eukprot:4426279-Prymnesium_polylepis.1
MVVRRCGSPSGSSRSGARCFGEKISSALEASTSVFNALKRDLRHVGFRLRREIVLSERLGGSSSEVRPSTASAVVSRPLLSLAAKR